MRGRTARPRLGERAAQRLDERGLRPRPELRSPSSGQQRREVGREWAAGLQQVGRAAQAFAQDVRDRGVWLGDRRARRTGVGGEARLRRARASTSRVLPMPASPVTSTQRP